MASKGWGLRGRRRARDAADDEAELDTVDLSGEEHAWWAARDDLDGGAPSGRSPKATPGDGNRKSTFEEYYSTESLFDGGFDVTPSPEHDPYMVLGVDELAPWPTIASAHRRLAKQHHPDRLVDPTPEELVRSEDRIRELNIAYTELRKRRGR